MQQSPTRNAKAKTRTSLISGGLSGLASCLILQVRKMIKPPVASPRTDFRTAFSRWIFSKLACSRARSHEQVLPPSIRIGQSVSDREDLLHRISDAKHNLPDFVPCRSPRMCFALMVYWVFGEAHRPQLLGALKTCMSTKGNDR